MPGVRPTNSTDPTLRLFLGRSTGRFFGRCAGVKGNLRTHGEPWRGRKVVLATSSRNEFKFVAQNCSFTFG